jgi:DNA-binding response OmpR family regulator
MKILSIDDSRAVHAFLDRSLGSLPYKLIHAMDGASGLKLIESEKDQLKLILLDWEMPGQSGPELLPLIKKLAPEIPVVMLTSKNNPDDIQTMILAGAVEYIMKPFTPDILVEKIQMVLGQ